MAEGYFIGVCVRVCVCILYLDDLYAGVSTLWNLGCFNKWKEKSIFQYLIPAFELPSLATARNF